LQLVVSSPEFHTTNNIVTKSGEDRVLPSIDIESPPDAPSETPPLDYKAIIYMDLNGVYGALSMDFSRVSSYIQ